MIRLCVLTRLSQGGGERGLLMAVLRRAILDYCWGKEDECGQDMMKQAEGWFHGTLGRPGLIGFKWLCEALDLDSGEVLRAVEKMKGAGGRLWFDEY